MVNLDPKDTIKEIVAQYPNIKALYEKWHTIDDDSIDTETFCDQYNVPFFDLWIEISSESSKIESAKRAEEVAKVQKEQEKKESRFRGFNFNKMTNDELIYAVGSLVVLFAGVIMSWLSIVFGSISAFILGVFIVITATVMIIRFVLKKEPKQYQRINFKKMSKANRLKAIFAYILLFGGVALFLVAKHAEIGHVCEALGIGLAVAGSTMVLQLTKPDNNK